MSKTRYTVMDKIDEANKPDDLELFDIYDCLSVKWSDFEFTGQEADKVLSKGDIERPDIASYHLYTDVQWQDIIFLVNNVGNILETDPGTKIKAPKVLDLKQFIQINRK